MRYVIIMIVVVALWHSGRIEKKVGGWCHHGGKVVELGMMMESSKKIHFTGTGKLVCKLQLCRKETLIFPFCVHNKSKACP